MSERLRYRYVAGLIGLPRSRPRSQIPTGDYSQHSLWKRYLAGLLGVRLAYGSRPPETVANVDIVQPNEVFAARSEARTEILISPSAERSSLTLIYIDGKNGSTETSAVTVSGHIDEHAAITPWLHADHVTRAKVRAAPAPRTFMYGPPRPPVAVLRRTLSTVFVMFGVLLAAFGLLLKVLLSDSRPMAVGTVQPPSSATAQSASAPPTTADASPDAEPSSIFGSQLLGVPVDGSVRAPGDVKISRQDYPNSIVFDCPTAGMLDWDVVGYQVFDAHVGIPDDASSATGIVDEMLFSDVGGRILAEVKVSLGQPVDLHFNLRGTPRLILSCNRVGQDNANENLVALGDASLSATGAG